MGHENGRFLEVKKRVFFWFWGEIYGFLFFLGFWVLGFGFGVLGFLGFGEWLKKKTQPGR